MNTEQNWQEIARKLWMLLDDIDTQDDASKSDDAHFRKCAYQIQQKRHQIISGDVVSAPPLPSGEKLDEMVNAFLSWPLPESVCSDTCATVHGHKGRSGTNLLTAVEAKAMFSEVVIPVIGASDRGLFEAKAIALDFHDKMTYYKNSFECMSKIFQEAKQCATEQLKEINALEDEVTSLRAQLKSAQPPSVNIGDGNLRETLAFYADKSNWDHNMVATDGGDEESTLHTYGKQEIILCGAKADEHGWERAERALTSSVQPEIGDGKDGERYRFLRRLDHLSAVNALLDGTDFNTLDAAVDHAMSAASPQADAGREEK